MTEHERRIEELVHTAPAVPLRARLLRIASGMCAVFAVIALALTGVNWYVGEHTRSCARADRTASNSLATAEVAALTSLRSHDPRIRATAYQSLLDALDTYRSRPIGDC